MSIMRNGQIELLYWLLGLLSNFFQLKQIPDFLHHLQLYSWRTFVALEPLLSTSVTQTLRAPK